MRRRKRIEASSHVGTAPETEPDEPVPYALTPLEVAWLERDFATRDRGPEQKNHEGGVSCVLRS